MLWISSLLKWYFLDWIHAEIFSAFNNLCYSVPNLCLSLLYFMHVLNRITLKWCSAEQHRGKWSGLQCTSQVKEEPWSLSHLTFYYIEATSVGKNPWTRLYSIALGKKLSRMRCLIKNWKWKIKSQDKFSFLEVVFTFIPVYHSMTRKQTITLKVLSLSVFKRQMDNNNP